ncbi:hypothetical protein KUTeg_006807 [Tegillarca granosa]|uniref:Phosphotransferase n=1 Tax=Tegillarca granosa TaxID=220873 RepID=A0ABQ9FDT1_TEGGR|nr:hypothetical protein KUTeg_006807 [Tegillarca granosa]
MEPTLKKLKTDDNEKLKKIEAVLQEYILSDDAIQKIIDAFEEQARLANSEDENERKKSDLFWECTYITKFITGKENGYFLGLDLGGTHFRVVGVKFTNGEASTVTKYYNLPEELYTGEAEKIVLDTEWQSFGDGGCLDFMKTDIDKEIDKYSNHPGEATFEKMFSGLYLGELVRQVLLKLVKDGLLFDGRGSDTLFQRNSFDTKYVTAIESDEGESTGNTKEVIKIMGLDGIATDQDISVVRRVCSVISQRGAYCIAAATAVLLYHINRPEVTIAVDGSLFEHHPKYEKHMLSLLSKLVPKTKVNFIFVKDGSGSGAAFSAAAMSQ